MHDDAPPCRIGPPRPHPFAVARIDETACIGCMLCVEACPVDAIVGATKLMHTVLAERCTGCELCLAPCPADCIAMVSAGRAWTAADESLAEARAGARRRRLGIGGAARGDHRASPPADLASDPAKARRQAAVAAALARARARRARRPASA